METNKLTSKKTGGRPTKAIKSNQFIGVKCSLIDKIILKQKAKTAGMTLSEYLRETGLNKNQTKIFKSLPKEVLQLSGMLNHLAANLNQLAKKRNQTDELNALERIRLQTLSTQVKDLATEIKQFFQ